MKKMNFINDRDDNILRMQIEMKLVPVKLQPCFPWKNAYAQISVQNMEGEEIGFIDELGHLDKESRSAVEFSLAEALFCFVIEDVISVRDEYELRVWEVKTAQGFRKFQTKVSDWPRHTSTNSYLIRDIFGDVFLLKDAGALSIKGFKKFKAFVD